MESLPEIDVVHSSPSELLAPPLNITVQQNVNGDNNSSSTQEPMETILLEQIDHKNAKSQKRKKSRYYCYRLGTVKNLIITL